MIKLTSSEKANLAKKAAHIRKNIVEMICNGKGGGHVGGALSCVDILVTLYFEILRLDLIVLSGMSAIDLSSVPGINVLLFMQLWHREDFLTKKNFSLMVVWIVLFQDIRTNISSRVSRQIQVH